MFKYNHSFSSVSVNDLDAAKKFYTEILGLAIEEKPGMGLMLKVADGHEVFLYPKADHVSATYTVLNFVVENIDASVALLKEKGIVFERYAGMNENEDIARGLAAQKGPDIAWFKDPAGNILSVLQNE